MTMMMSVALWVSFKHIDPWSRDILPSKDISILRSWDILPCKYIRISWLRSLILHLAVYDLLTRVLLGIVLLLWWASLHHKRSWWHRVLLLVLLLLHLGLKHPRWLLDLLGLGLLLLVLQWWSAWVNKVLQCWHYIVTHVFGHHAELADQCLIGLALEK